MRVLLWLTFIAAVAVHICLPVQDPDLWWHITVGRWILAHGDVPTVDYWTMFGSGQPWRAYSWLPEILFAAVDARWSIAGLLVLKLLLSFCIVGSFAWSYGRISKDRLFGALLGAFAAGACSGHFTLRPQSFTWILFALLLAALDAIEREGLTRRRGAQVVLLMMLWANIHLTTILGIAAIVCWLWPTKRTGDWGIAWKVLGLGVLGTLLTPYVGGEWITLISKSGHPFSHRSIAEFSPATIMEYPTAFTALAAALLAAFWHFRPRAIEGPKLIAAGAFMLGGLAVLKFLPIASILLCALIARAWSAADDKAKAFGGLGEGIERLRKGILWVPKEGLSLVLIALAVIGISGLWRSPISRDVVPVDAVSFIRDYSLPHPIMNAFGQGGYVMYRLSDAQGNLEYPVSIDGRTNVGPPELGERHEAAFFGRKNWREYYEMVKPNTILWRSDSPLLSILAAEGSWCQVLTTGSARVGNAVLVKKEWYRKNLKPKGIAVPECD